MRGEYLERSSAKTNVVVLDPEVSAAFPSAEAASQALSSPSRAYRAGRPKMRDISEGAGGQAQRSCGLTPARAASTCRPHPVQVGLPQRSHWIR